MAHSILTSRLSDAIWSLAFGFSPGPQEMLIVGIIALLLFGKRLPEVARNLGKGFSEFKKGMQNAQDEIRTASSSAGHVNYNSNSATSSADRPAPDMSTADDDFAAPKFEIED